VRDHNVIMSHVPNTPPCAPNDLVIAKLTKIVRSRNNIDCTAFRLGCRQTFRSSSSHNDGPHQIWCIPRVCFVIESAKRRAGAQSIEEIRSSSDHRRTTNLFHVDVSRLMRWLLCSRHLHSASVVGARLCRKLLGKHHVGWQGSKTKPSFSSHIHVGKFC
jgi:hypothetical protein